VLVEVGFSYCSKKKCGGFADANFDSWFPYTDDQRIYLLSNKNDRDTFSGLTIVKSTPNEAGGSFESGKCDLNAQVKNNLYSSANYLYLEYYKSLEIGISDYTNLSLKDAKFKTLGLNDSGLIVNN
jgi:hypothetical protein